MTSPLDTSGAGKSALQAAAYKGWEAEIYSYTEEHVTGVFHDFDKCLATTDLAILMEENK